MRFSVLLVAVLSGSLLIAPVARAEDQSTCANIVQVVQRHGFLWLKKREFDVPLLGMASYAPESAEMAAIKSRFLKLKLDEIPRFNRPFRVVRDLTKDRRGMGYYKRFIIEADGKLYHLKYWAPKGSRTKDHLLNEIRWYLIGNKVGLCAEFFGVHRTMEPDPDTGKPMEVIGIVTEWHDGFDAEFGFEEKYDHYPFHEKLIRADVDKAANLLTRLGVNPNNLQFIFTPEGHAIIIDPELWHLSYYKGDVENQIYYVKTRISIIAGERRDRGVPEEGRPN